MLLDVVVFIPFLVLTLYFVLPPLMWSPRSCVDRRLFDMMKAGFTSQVILPISFGRLLILMSTVSSLLGNIFSSPLVVGTSNSTTFWLLGDSPWLEIKFPFLAREDEHRNIYRLILQPWWYNFRAGCRESKVAMRKAEKFGKLNSYDARWMTLCSYFMSFEISRRFSLFELQVTHVSFADFIHKNWI